METCPSGWEQGSSENKYIQLHINYTTIQHLDNFKEKGQMVQGEVSSKIEEHQREKNIKDRRTRCIGHSKVGFHWKTGTSGNLEQFHLMNGNQNLVSELDFFPQNGLKISFITQIERKKNPNDKDWAIQKKSQNSTTKRRKNEEVGRIDAI